MNDKFTGFTVSLLIHGALFTAGGFLLVKPPVYGVTKGTSGMEINLVAAPAEPKPVVVQETKESQPVISSETIPAKVEKPVQQKLVPKEETQGKDKVNFHSAGGAISEAKPDYFQNPAPEYPLEARRKGWEGTVILKVVVDKEGNPADISIVKSCGHSLLDQTALKAVKHWKFLPAKLGDVSMESTVKVPIRFDLENS